MAERAKVLRGPWGESVEPTRPAASAPIQSRTGPARAEASRAPAAPARTGASADRPPEVAREEETIAPGRLHLGFVVRDCTVALGHRPTPAEFAYWANHQCDERGEFRLFGRDITAAEAKVILAHPGRAVTVRPERARPHGADGGGAERAGHGPESASDPSRSPRG